MELHLKLAGLGLWFPAFAGMTLINSVKSTYDFEGGNISYPLFGLSKGPLAFFAPNPCSIRCLCFMHKK